MPAFPSNLEFASYLQYSPRGTSTISAMSRDFTYKIKQDGYLLRRSSGVLESFRVIDDVAMRLALAVANNPFLQNYFNNSVTLVPAPRSTPLVQNALWPTRRICDAIMAQGVAGMVAPYIERIKPVQKSAGAPAGQRPNPDDHYESVAVIKPDLLDPPVAITLVDDVVTRGSSFVGLYQRLKEEFPGVPVRCFAVVRTISSAEVTAIAAPVQGIITFNGVYLSRNP